MTRKKEKPIDELKHPKTDNIIQRINCHIYPNKWQKNNSTSTSIYKDNDYNSDIPNFTIIN